MVFVMVFLATLAVLTINDQHNKIVELQAQLSKADFDLAISELKNNKE